MYNVQHIVTLATEREFNDVSQNMVEDLEVRKIVDEFKKLIEVIYLN